LTSVRKIGPWLDRSETITPVPDTELDPLILAFYRDRYDEDERLSRSRHGQLEFLRTQQLLRAHLPAAPASVLDVGGGTGVHARWLAADGYAVHLIDPVPGHVEQARRRGGFTVAVGDARALQVPDDSVDVALLLGPLYHLVEAADRIRALEEAVRVVRPGGLVAAAAISRYAPLLELAGLGTLTEDAATELAELLRTGVGADDPQGFTTAYFHGAEDLARELADAGLKEVAVLGIEGPAAPALDNAPAGRAADVLASAVRCAQMAEADPALIAASPHLLGLGRIR
jgi:ubiquinone/menaquinone biosynthesis C-methylase UbiE